MTVFWGLMIPLAGTTLGSACVFFLKDKLNELLQKGLLGFASGVMVAASVWSLLIPSMDMAAGMGRLAFVPACFWAWCFYWGWTALFRICTLVHRKRRDQKPP